MAADLDLNQLRVLDVLLEEQRVASAARRLGVSPSAVSHTLAKLRKRTGDPLFVRTRRGMEPTPLARSLAGPLRTTFAALEGMLADLDTFDPATAQRTFALSTSDYGQLALLPGLLARLKQQAPGVAIVVRPVPERMLDELERGVLDLAVGSYPDAPSSLRSQVLFRDGFSCLVPAGSGPWDLQRWLAAPHVLVSPRGLPGSYVDRQLAAQGLRRHVALTVPNFLVTPHVVAEAEHVCTLPSRLAAQLTADPRVAAVPPPIELPQFPIHQVWHERVHRHPAHRWLRTQVQQSTP